MTNEFEHDHELIEARWLEEQGKTLDLDPQQLDAAFEHEPGVCTCIDEGTDGDIRLAGSGILHPGGIDAVADILRRQGVTKVTAHEHCGAAAIAYRRDHPNEHEIDNEKVDQYAADWARQLADRLSVDYQYIAQGEMHRPIHLHDASAVYIDMVGHFQPQRIAELPKGFVISAKLEDTAAAMREIELAASIALGPAGFGDKFTPDSPLKLVVVGDRDPVMDQALDELRQVHGDRVVIQNIAVPIEQQASA
jgi:hypothetical protein